MYESKNVVNAEVWESYQDKNSDAYGGCCIKITRRVMQYLDENPVSEFNIGYAPDMTTPHGIISHCDHDDGITGFMAGAVRNMIAACYLDGWKFFLADVISQYDVDNEDAVTEKIEKVYTAIDEGTVLCADREDVRSFVEAMLNRFKAKGITV